MNVQAIIVEQLEWDGHLRTLVFQPDSESEFWVALLDEYVADSAGPFHMLNPMHEREFDERMATQPARLAGGFRKLDADSATFETSWRGIPTAPQSRTIYALSLPEGTVPDNVAFIDPRPPHRTFTHREVLDRMRRRVVCYLDCRSRYGQFDFDVRIELRRDRDANHAFIDSPSTGWPSELDGLEDIMTRMPGGGQTVIQQFFHGSTSVFGNEPTVVVGGSSLTERAKASTWTKAWALAAAVATVAAAVLLAAGVADVGIAGFVVAVIAVLVAILPLLRD